MIYNTGWGTFARLLMVQLKLIRKEIVMINILSYWFSDTLECGLYYNELLVHGLRVVQHQRHTRNIGRVSSQASVPDPGEGPGGPCPLLLLDQTEARRTEKKIFKTAPPPTHLRIWMTVPLSEGLDTPLGWLYCNVAQDCWARLVSLRELFANCDLSNFLFSRV